MVSSSEKPVVVRQSTPEPTTSLTKTTSTANKILLQSARAMTALPSSCRCNSRVTSKRFRRSEKPMPTASSSVQRAGPLHSPSPRLSSLISEGTNKSSGRVETISVTSTLTVFFPPRPRPHRPPPRAPRHPGESASRIPQVRAAHQQNSRIRRTGGLPARTQHSVPLLRVNGVGSIPGRHRCRSGERGLGERSRARQESAACP